MWLSCVGNMHARLQDSVPHTNQNARIVDFFAILSDQIIRFHQLRKAEKLEIE